MMLDKIIKFLKKGSIPLVIILTVVILSCENNEPIKEGEVTLHLTDAPTDAESVEGVFVTIIGVEFTYDNASWEEFESFGDPKMVNLLDLNNGETALIGTFDVDAGLITGLRFHLDLSNEPNDLTTFLEYKNGTREVLSVPSGAETGFKAVGDFNVPSNGAVIVVADFDVRKSVVEAGTTGKYILRPAIRTVTIELSGFIEGTVSNAPAEGNVVVYAYEQGDYSGSEADTPATGEARFQNAITSDKVDAGGNYKISYLKEGTYDFIVAHTDAKGNFVEVLGIEEGIDVAMDTTVTLNLDISVL